MSTTTVAPLLHLTDDLLAELYDVYLAHGGAPGGGLVGVCRRLYRLLHGRFVVMRRAPDASVAPAYEAARHIVWFADAVPFDALARTAAPGLLRMLAVVGGPCRDAAGLAAGLARCSGLRSFRWSVRGGRLGTDPAAGDVIRALDGLRSLESLDVSLSNCGLDGAALDTVLCAPLEFLRSTNRLRSLKLRLSENCHLGVDGVRRLVRSVVASRAADDRLERLDLTLWDIASSTDPTDPDDALAACAGIGECPGLRCLVLDASGMRQTSSHGVRVGLAAGVLRHNRWEALDLRLAFGAGCRTLAVRDLFAALGRRPPDTEVAALRALSVDLSRCALRDKDLANGLLAPLAGAGGAALTDLSLYVGGAELGLIAIDRLAVLAPRLRSLVLRGVLRGSETTTVTQILAGGMWSLRRFELTSFPAYQRWYVDFADLQPDEIEAPPPRWPASLDTLRLDLSESRSAAHWGQWIHSRRGVALPERLTEVYLGLRNVGMTTDQWTSLCTSVGGLTELRNLHLDVRGNLIRSVVPGLEALEANIRLTQLRLCFDGNYLTEWTEEESAVLPRIPDAFPRLCHYHLSLRNCSLPYGLTARVALSGPVANKQCRVAYSF